MQIEFREHVGEQDVVQALQALRDKIIGAVEADDDVVLGPLLDRWYDGDLQGAMKRSEEFHIDGREHLVHVALDCYYDDDEGVDGLYDVAVRNKSIKVLSFLPSDKRIPVRLRDGLLFCEHYDEVLPALSAAGYRIEQSDLRYAAECDDVERLAVYGAYSDLGVDIFDLNGGHGPDLKGNLAHVAADRGAAKTLALLDEQGVSLDSPVEYVSGEQRQYCYNTVTFRPGDKPAHLVAQQGHNEAAQVLAACQAVPNTTNFNFKTPAQIAFNHGHMDMLRDWIYAGVDVEGFGEKPDHGYQYSPRRSENIFLAGIRMREEREREQARSLRVAQVEGWRSDYKRQVDGNYYGKFTGFVEEMNGLEQP